MLGALLVSLLPLGQVAKVDIRATGPVTNAEALKGMLSTAYAGAGIGGAGTIIPASDMTLNTMTPGHFVLEVDTGYATASQLDGYWCVNDPALRNHFKDLVVLGTGLSAVTDVITCVGAAGEGCAASTPCGGGGGGDVDDDGTPDPAPEPEPEPAPAPEPTPKPSGDGDDDNNGLSTVAIVLIVVGVLVVMALILYLLWPTIAAVCFPTPAPLATQAVMAPVEKGGGSTERCAAAADARVSSGAKPNLTIPSEHVGSIVGECDFSPPRWRLHG